MNSYIRNKYKKKGDFIPKPIDINPFPNPPLKPYEPKEDQKITPMPVPDDMRKKTADINGNKDGLSLMTKLILGGGLILLLKSIKKS